MTTLLTRVRLFCTVLMCVFPMITHAEVLPGMKELSDGEVATASDMNANFGALSDKSLNNAQRIERLENTSTRLFKDNSSLTAKLSGTMELGDGIIELPGGRLELDVDCNNDQWALVDAYQAYGRYKELILNLSGTCYGAYYFNRDFTESFREPFQKLALKASADARAAIVTRPYNETIPSLGHNTRVFVYAREGSRLELENVDIYLGLYDALGVWVADNSTARFSGVGIYTAEGNNFGGEAGIKVTGNSFVQFDGTRNTIDIGNSSASFYSALLIEKGSVVESFAGVTAKVTSNSECHALDIRDSQLFTDTGGAANAWQSIAVCANPNDFAVYADNATLRFDQNGEPFIADGNFRAESSHLQLHGGLKLARSGATLSVSGPTDITHYDNEYLPAASIKCSALNTVNFWGLSDPANSSSYGYLTHDETVLAGIDQRCVSTAEWDSVLRSTATP